MARIRRQKVQTAMCAVCAAMLIGALAATGAAPALGRSGQAADKTGKTGRTVSVVCRGGGNACKAVVSVAGGASREKVRIALSDTDLKLARVVPKPKSIKGAYQLYGGKYTLGGSLYTVMLNAVQAIPRGATLTFEFSVPRVAHST